MLENQEKLCIKNCGSIEEFMSHTKKVCFQNFGVESRIWRKNEEIPYIGKWISEENYDELLINDFTNSFSPVVFDSFVKDNLYNISTKKKSETFEELVKKAFVSFPSSPHIVVKTVWIFSLIHAFMAATELL